MTAENKPSFFWPGLFILLAFSGWATAIAGMVILYMNSPASTYTTLITYWIHLALFFCIMLGYIYWFYVDSSRYPRFTLLAFLASTLGFLVTDLDLFAVITSNAGDLSKLSNANVGILTATIGFGILLFVWIYWMLYVGLGLPGKARRSSGSKIKLVEERRIEDLV